MSKITPRRLRVATALFFFVVVTVGLLTNLAPGTLSSFGFESIALICPLGALETMLASQSIIPLVLSSLLCVVIMGVLLGKVFCGWICPVSLVSQRAPKAQSPRQTLNSSQEISSLQESPVPLAMRAPLASSASRVSPASLAPSKFHSFKLRAPHVDTRALILLLTLVSTVVFGFPVFCLACPVGITFAVFIGLWRLVAFNEPSWMLLVFPAVLALELLVYKKWCHNICPLGAVFSLASSLNRFLRPWVDANTCLRTSKQQDCTVCKEVCPERIMLHNAPASRPLAECTKCHECSAACPARAISFRRKKQGRSEH